MQQKIFVLGNWKMNPATPKEATVLLKKYRDLAVPREIELACAVPFPYLSLARKTWGKAKIGLAIQNMYPGKAGAQTGEVTLPMFTETKPTYVIIGHSERRAFGESDELINQKILSAIKYGVTPVLCIGERERDEHGFFLRTIADMLKNDLKDVSKNALSKIVIAYEPVWAIGTHATRPATPEECREMIVFIKKTISDISGGTIKTMPRVIYGGSVNELDARLFIEAGADGVLPGHVSLDAKKMQKVLQNITAVRTV